MGNVGIEIRVEGESDPIEVSKVAYDLYSDLRTRKKAVEVLKPLQNEGYDSLQFYRGDAVFTEFCKNDIPESDGTDLPEVIPQNSNVSTINTKVRIRKAAYEGKSKWTLIYKSAIEASIEDTEWLETLPNKPRNGPPGSYLDVDLKEVYTTTENGEMVGQPSYSVLKVNGVLQPPEQLKLPTSDAPSQLDERWSERGEGNE